MGKLDLEIEDLGYLIGANLTYYRRVLAQLEKEIIFTMRSPIRARKYSEIKKQWVHKTRAIQQKEKAIRRLKRIINRLESAQTELSSTEKVSCNLTLKPLNRVM